MKADNGDTVIVLYNGILENGEVFDSSDKSGPLEFLIGSASVLPEFEKNIIGMHEGESKSFTLPPESAYGASQPELIQTFDRKSMPDAENLTPGMVLGLTIEKDGEQHKVPALLTALDATSVTVDFNNPLAGKHLTYNVTLQAIAKPE